MKLISHALWGLLGITLSHSAIAQTLQTSFLHNFDEPNSTHLIQAIQQKNIHIIQLGDSHTAGDSMTGELREQLQKQLGQGGMGWGMPMYFSGQRLAKYGYDNKTWQPISSRTQTKEHYTIGGLIAKPSHNGATLTIKSKQNNDGLQNFLVSIRQSEDDQPLTGIDANGQHFTLQAPIKNNTWQLTQVYAKPPFTITAHQASNTAIGGWWGLNPQNTGATVSALGINGAELSHWNRWNNDAWQNELNTIQPQLIILAYGTNEAYNNVSPARVTTILSERILQLREAVPHAAIMIISAPESLKQTAGTCGTRPAVLSEIQQVQKQIAEQYRTLYWDWQAAMGGECSMKSWINQGLASRDGVHFTHTGYAKLGKQLAQDLLHLASP